MKLPAVFEPFVFGALLFGLLFIVSGIATWNAIGLVPNFAVRRIEGWLFALSMAFPTVLVVARFVRRLTRLVVASSSAARPSEMAPS